MRSLVGVLVLLALVVAFAGCGASKASDQAPRAADAGVQAADPVGAGEAAAVDVEADAGESFTDTCHGVVSCTFFGLGAALALPFWVLGAALGLVF